MIAFIVSSKGIMETSAGLGYTAGPVLGGFLYELGGFQMPFFVLGMFLVIVTGISYQLVEEIEGCLKFSYSNFLFCDPSAFIMWYLSSLHIFGAEQRGKAECWTSGIGASAQLGFNDGGGTCKFF